MRTEGFDRRAAVTRSLLGYGVVAGGFYLVVGLVLALTRDGFELSRHPLSLLMLGDGGWLQQGNLILTGLMTVAAGVGFSRAMRGSVRGTRAGAMLIVYGLCLIASALAKPDPMEGFPPGAAGDEATASGVLHLAFGAIGFISLAVAALAVGGWCAWRGERGLGVYARASGIVVLLGFVAGAGLAGRGVGVAALWLAVVVGWLWLAVLSVHLYRTVPHPDADRRNPVQA